MRKIKVRTTEYRSPLVVLVTMIVTMVGAIGVAPRPAHAVRAIIFPEIGPVSFSDDFGAPRVGHTHQGNDILGRKGLPLVAAVDGYVQWVITPEKGAGLGFSIRGDDGYAYWYLHVNNDTPGTDDGASRGIFAYAPGLYGGNPVVAGQLLGWMGDSGNAEGTVAHLHFEMHNPDGDAFDPYESLIAAQRISTPVIPPALPDEILPYGQFTGGASIAIGELDRNRPGSELAVSAGPGGGPQVRVYGADSTLIAQFFAFEPTFKGGTDIAIGDTDGDGTDEIIVTSRRGRITQARVFTMDGTLLDTLAPYGDTFIGGANVAAADLNGDGKSEFIVGPLRGGGPNVRVYDGPTHALLGWFFAYAPSYRGGVDVGAFVAAGSQPSLIVTTPLHGGGPNARIYRGDDRSLINWFFAGPSTDRTGRRVTLANVDTATDDPEIVVVPEYGGSPVVTIYDLSGNEVDRARFLEPWWEGGYDVAAAPGVIATVTAAVGETRRRTTIRFPFGELSDTIPNDGFGRF